MPLRKSAEEGKVEIISSLAPLTGPLAFANSKVVCFVAGGSVCVWDLETETRRYIHTTVYSITRLCANPVKGLVAFCEGGTSPQILVYSVEPRLLFTLSDVTELEVADLSFSRCGSRLYTLSRSKMELCVFSTVTGQMLPGCALALPMRFDRVSVFPGHKDRLALVRSSSVRIVTLQKSFGTHIVSLRSVSIPANVDVAVSSYTWTPSGHFLFATGDLLCTLDGFTGCALQVCRAEGAITGLMWAREYVLTAHGNDLRFWTHAPIHGTSFTKILPMDSCGYMLRHSLDFEALVRGGDPGRTLGTVTHLQVTPDFASAMVTTTEGDIWSLELNVPEREGTDVRLEFLTWSHTGVVTDMCFLGASGQVCASADDSGCVRLWETRSGSLKECPLLRFPSVITSVVSDDTGKVLVVGSERGCVHVIACAQWRRPRVVQTVRISDGVAQLCGVSHNGRGMSVAAALYNNKIAFFAVSFRMFREAQVQVLGYVELGSVEDISFHERSFNADAATPARLLVVGTVQYRSDAVSCLWVLRGPPLDHEPQEEVLRRDVCPLQSMKLSDGKLEDRATTVASFMSDVVVVGFANGHLRTYGLPETPGHPARKVAVSPPLHSFAPGGALLRPLPPQGQFISRLRVSRDGAWLVVSCMDGSVRKFAVGSTENEFHKFLHSPFCGGVSQCVISTNGSLILSTGGIDGVTVWSDSQMKSAACTVSAEEIAEAEMTVTEVNDQEMAYPLWSPVARAVEEADPEQSAMLLSQRRGLEEEVEGLRRKMRLLVDANTEGPELERLTGDEFCVDFEQRDFLASQTQERCDELRAKIERENVSRQLIRDRFIKEFWDPMGTKGCQICSLMSNLSVSNYPERVQSEQRNIMRKLRFMRQVELLDARMGQSSDALREDRTLQSSHFTAGSEPYIVNWWPIDGTSLFSNDTPLDARSDLELLYEPFELLTNSRRRLQVWLLQAVAVGYRAAFNELFKKCQDEKRGTIDQMKEKISRIRSVLVELQVGEEVPEPELQDCEEANSVLNIKDRDITAEKWVPEKERKVMEEARAKEEERLRLLKENDAGQRALVQMMGGTLKTKKDLSPLEIILDRESWMEIPHDEMTDAQKLALKEFEERERILAEEQDRYRKQLDAELKRLRSEVRDHMQHFEVVLKELYHQRFFHDASYFCQELYCLRLQLALLQSIEDSEILTKYTQDVEEVRAKLAVSDAKLETFRAKYDAVRERLEEKTRHEKEISSSAHFRQAFVTSGLEQEAITALWHIYKKRRDGPLRGADGGARNRQSTPATSEAGSRKGSFQEPVAHRDTTSTSLAVLAKDPFNVVSVGDPYPDQGVLKENPSDDVHDESFHECPEGIDDANFRKMLEMRKDRIQAEIEVQKGSAVLHEMNSLLVHLQKERDEAESEHDTLQTAMATHRQLMDRELYDIEVLFKLKQGQVEVPQAAVVTDYSDAVVIDRDVVELRNKRIVALGDHKIGTLGVIKEFRRKLNLIQWEHKKLALETTDLEERAKDMQMLRVTKGLQSILKNGEEGRSKADADLLERKIEHLSNNTAQKEQALKKQYALSHRAMKIKKNENIMLEKKLFELQQNVIQREHIRRLKSPAGAGRTGEKPRILGGGGKFEENEAEIQVAQATFEEVKTKRGLMDVVTRHTEEIEVLRKELDRLRQKTFPSFVQMDERPGRG